MAKKWFEIINKADKAEIWIYEQIGEDFWTGGGITAKSFQKELAGIKASQIDLHINSPGGEVFDGITIYNLIKQHPANVTTYIDGLAASIASVIALAGDSVIMAENALYMIHNPWGFAMGDATEMRKTADLLDKVAGSLVTAYTSKTGKPDDDIQTLLDAETWMTAQEAKDAGFIDEISEQMDMAACAKFIPAMQKAKFKNIPENLSGNKQTPTAREAEKALRDVGFTQAQAKSILADGFKGDQRDVAPVADQRDVAAPEPKKKDRVADLLTRAELMAPSH
jgi:ATP-dependent Clp endopeptidase proteolytic subunit ClpP